MGWKVIIAPSAQADLESIVRFIAQHNNDAAARIGYELIVRTQRLAAFPEIDRVVPEFEDTRLREIIHRSYRIIYRVQHERERIEVVRFWHGARGLPQIPR
jgi:toxin ParE1/3/4